MKTRTEIRNWLLENAVDKDGDLMLSNLDFSEFDGDVYIDSMKVKGYLWQHNQEVQGDYGNAIKLYKVIYTKENKMLKETYLITVQHMVGYCTRNHPQKY